MKNKNTVIGILVIVCLLLLAAVGYTVVNDKKEKENLISNGKGESQSGIVTVNGKKYKRNSDVHTVLFMGIDKSEKAELHRTPGENGQSDSLNLLAVNRAEKTAQIIQISRDSMVNIDIYGASGEKLMSEEGQIALQYAYGDGEEESCRLTSKKVSELMYGVEIDSYVSLTMDGMIAASDELGGITLTVPADYTAIDPGFAKGETLTLNGEMAEKYVRSRDIEALDSNNQRMERQAQFMQALIVKLQGLGSNSRYLSLYEKMEPYMVTNMTAEEMMELSEYEIASDMMKVPGEVIEKDGHAQYIVDNKKLQQIILKVFYKSL